MWFWVPNIMAFSIYVVCKLQAIENGWTFTKEAFGLFTESNRE